MPSAKKRLLIIDDDESFQYLAANLFAGDLESLTAGDGDAGLALALRHKPAVILLDVVIPRLSGFELLRHFQAVPELRQIPVIMISASVVHGSIVELFTRESNVRAYLQKPCPMEQLRSTVLQAMRTA